MSEDSATSHTEPAAVARLRDEPFFQTSLDLLCLATFDRRFVLLNPRWTEVLGWSLEHLLATPFLELAHPDDVESTVQVLSALGDGGNVLEFSNRFRRADGSYRRLAWRAIPADDGLIYASARDMTDVEQNAVDLQRLTEALATAARFDRAENHLLAAFSSSDELPTVLGSVLEGLAEHLGLAPSALYLPERDSRPLIRVASLGLQTGEAGEAIGAEGAVAQVASSRRPIMLEGERVARVDVGLGAVEAAAVAVLPLVHRDRLHGVLSVACPRPFGGTHRDFFERIAPQLGVALHNARQLEDLRDLSNQVEARGQEVEAKNLELVQANRLKSEFLATMSHELRTPLNAIIGFSEVLRDGMVGELEATQRGYVDEIFSAGGHLLSLINDILDLSKVEAGRMVLEPTSVHLPDVLRAGIAVVREAAQRGEVSLVLEVDEALPPVFADARKLTQIVYNLLSNAVKFTQPGGRVALRGQVADDQCVIEVQDTGIGIADQDQQRLFEPFVQLDGSMARRFDGTGLGLALVNRFVALHGGEVDVESAAGRGALFRVRLPGEAARGEGQGE